MHALVYVDRLFREEPFLVSIPAGIEGEIVPGCQVMLSLVGHSASGYIGYIALLVGDHEAAAPEGEILDLLAGGRPVLSPPLLKLAMWMAAYYLSRPIDCITTTLPAPLRSVVDDSVELTEFRLESTASKVRNSGLRRRILQELSGSGRLTVRQLRKRLGRRELYKTLSELERGGLVRMTKSFTESRPRTKTSWRLAPCLPENPRALIARSPRKLEAFELLAATPDRAYPVDETGFSRELLNGLVTLGLAEKIEVEVSGGFVSKYRETPKKIDTLGVHQQAALDELASAAAGGGFRTFLLHGVTGSGKTIVYIELLRRVLDAGRTAIVLVPEIALTPQTASRFRHYFGDDIQIMHSAMSSQEKYDAWQRLRQGKARIALGARSTIFAPLENLGAVIVDEEHDTAYKQDRNPRYQARDTAVMRAKLEGALCVLGSATPSFESYANAQAGKYTLLELPERVDGASMPKVGMVWMPGSQRVTPSISGALYDAIRLRIERDQQVILLQNRRGFAGSVLCLECGQVPHCRSCNIPLVYHTGDQTLRCHYCGHTEPFTGKCAACASEKLFYKSSGTERIEEELQELFPDEKILRMDVDTTGTRDAHAEILSAFGARKARILLGTQMVAKGLDFPDVTLVGVLMADIGLNIPDFRAAERIYALLTQVSGRAGRSSQPGEVILQLYNRDNELFRHLLEGDYRKFYEAEMVLRTELAYPPASKLVKFEFTAPVEVDAEAGASAFAQGLRTIFPPGTAMILGPAPAGISRIKGRYRHQIIIKIQGTKPSMTPVRELQQEVTSAFRRQGLLIIADVDPQNLL